MRPRVQPKGTQVRTKWTDTYQQLEKVMHDLGLDEWSVTGYQDARRLGFVTLRYQDEGRTVEITVTVGGNPESQIRAIWYAMDARRLNIIRGVDDAVAATYLALPAPARERDPWEVLGVRPDAPLEVVRAAYRELAKSAHPDRGGSDERMAELNAALERLTGGK